MVVCIHILKKKNGLSNHMAPWVWQHCRTPSMPWVWQNGRTPSMPTREPSVSIKSLPLLSLPTRWARDSRERVSELAGHLLMLLAGASVAEVLSQAWVVPDELIYGSASWCCVLDAFQWLMASAPSPARAPTLSSSSSDALARMSSRRSSSVVGECTTVQVFNAMMGVYTRSRYFDDV